MPATLICVLCLATTVCLAAPAFAQNAKQKEGVATVPFKLADYTSAHILLHTDLAQPEAKELLARLETMLSLISAYWRRPPSGVIECYVARDIARWPTDVIDPHGRAKIEQGAGVTLTQTLSSGKRFLAKATVYAVSDRGTPQHEVVHAYCQQAFGRAGPIWYAEGMAEMGQYWRDNDASVHCHPEVVKYLHASVPRPLGEIVNAGKPIEDNWQNYAWRWALCHLLANNPNYSARFLPLGLGYLNKQQNVTFERVYGAMADDISFEYVFFLKHFDIGYRVDLTAWDWKRKFVAPAAGTAVTSHIAADRGWQPAGILLKGGVEYEYSATGTWKLAKDSDAITADGKSGAPAGSDGRLVGVVMQDFKLGEPFDLGAEGTFTASGDGKLYLRCRDKWNELQDNKGSLAVKIKSKGAAKPPRPAGATELPSDSEKKTLK